MITESINTSNLTYMIDTITVNYWNWVLKTYKAPQCI